MLKLQIPIMHSHMDCEVWKPITAPCWKFVSLIIQSQNAENEECKSMYFFSLETLKIKLNCWNVKILCNIMYA